MSKEKQSLETEIENWVNSADVYNFSLDSTKSYITKRILDLATNLAKEAYVAGGNGGYYDEGIGGMNYEFSEETWNEFIKDKI